MPRNLCPLRTEPVPQRRPLSLPGHLATWLLIVAFVALVVTTSGCRDRREMPTRPSATAQSQSPASSVVTEETGDAVQEQSETWDAVYLHTQKIGYLHTIRETLLQESGENMVRMRSRMDLTIPRYQENTSVRTQLMSLETPDGAVRRFRMESTMPMVVVEGTHRHGEMEIVTITQGKRTRRSLPWDDSTGGLFAMEQSLRNQPMQPGEKRQLKMLMPGMSGVLVVDNDMRARTWETVDLLEGSEELLKVEIRTHMGDQPPIESICWTSGSGEILKSTVPAIRHTLYRTSQERAQAAEQSGSYDLGVDSIIPLDTFLPHPHELTRAEYEVTLSSGDPVEVFASGASQNVQKIDATRAQVTVIAVRPDSPLSDTDEAPPEADDLASSNLVQADDPEVVKLARQIVGEESDPWRKCVALEHAVYELIDEKNYGKGLDTAADVVQSRSGDCTEHAVLLAALCRAEQVPARVVLGLVYSPSHHGFAFHMWNEAWVKDRWIPLDGTLGKGGIGVGHLKISHSNLTSEESQTVFMSVLSVINQLGITLLDFEPR